MTRRPGPGSLWRDRGFTVFLTAQTLSVAGDSFALIAVPLLVLRVTGSVAQMGLLTGMAGVIAVDAASFAVSAAGVLIVRRSLLSRRPATTDSVAPAGPVPAGCSATPSGTATPGASGAGSSDGPVSGRPDAAGTWRELLAGARFLWQHPALRALTVLLTFFIFATYGLPDVLIYYLKHGLGQGDGVVGLVLAIAALGTVAGALAVAPLRRRLGFGRCWTGAVVLCGLAVAGLGASGSVPAVAVLAALYLGCISLAGISSMSLRQEVTPDHLLGRVTAAFWTIHFSLGPAGAALLTWAAGHFGVLAACVASGAACLVIGTIALATPVWRLSRNPVRPLPET